MLDVIQNNSSVNESAERIAVASKVEDKDSVSTVTYQLSSEVIQLCQQFVNTVDAIKAI